MTHHHYFIPVKGLQLGVRANKKHASDRFGPRGGARSGGPPAEGPAMGHIWVVTRAFWDSGPRGRGRARSLPGETRDFFSLSKLWPPPEAQISKFFF